MTSPNRCLQVVKSYLSHLESDFESIESDFGCVIVTPFVRPDGESIEIAVEPLHSEAVRLTDMGDTLGYLFVNGMTLTRVLMENARQISQPYGVSLDGSAFVIHPETQSDFGDALHRIIQTVLSTTEMIQKRQPSPDSHFESAVESLFVTTHNQYDVNYQVQGQREPHMVRFHIDSGKRLLVQPLSLASETRAHERAEQWAYRFGDIQAQDDTWQIFALLDDRDDSTQVWTPRSMTPITEYQLLWSQRQRLQEIL